MAGATYAQMLLLAGDVAGTTYSGRFSSGNYIRRLVSAGLSGINMTGPRTVEFWVRFNSHVNNGWLGCFWGVPTTSRGYVVMTQTNKLRAVYHNATGDTAVNWAWSPSLTTWYHVMVVIDPTQVGAANEFKGYIDTVSLGTPTVEADQGVAASTAVSTGEFCPSAYTSGNLATDVWMDEYRIWDDDHSAYVATNWKQHVDPGSANLQYYGRWENDAWVDITANGYDMTAVGSPTFETEVPTW